jgi:DNA-directed RNA polymerase omega subunit
MDKTDERDTNESAAPAKRVAPIESRFLFVDVAAMRAKQLRRGALPRFGPDGEGGREIHKAERVAMEEVRRGLVQYSVPELVLPHAGHHYER